MNKYPYLKDSAFLFDLFRTRNLEQFVNITVLNFNEKPLKEVQGKVLSGNFNLDGNSSVRRTGNLSVFIEERDADYMEVNGYFSMNKKIKVEIGLTNNTNKYKEFPIIWFPQGLFVIMNLSISRGTSGTNVSLQLKDKMVFLNGECGGTLPAAITFSEYEDINPETGEYVVSRPTLVQIIRELVNHWGGEQLGKIVISDIDTRIKKVMKWTKTTPLYAYHKNIGDRVSIEYSLQKRSSENPKEYGYGRDVGYINVDFYYPGELEGNAGDSVCTILDKIKNLLGNFEYYYDLDGNFIFQEVKNYLNNTPKVRNLEESQFDIRDNYIIKPRKGKALYDFNICQDLITSYSNSPQYSQVKNDFLVWGIREGIDKQKLPFRYHLAIDKKPQVGNKYNIIAIKDEKITSDEVFHIKVPIPKPADTVVGDVDRIYEKDGKLYKWIPKDQKYVEIIETNIKKGVLKTLDWRTELYLAGSNTSRFGVDSNYYYSELANEWPKLFELKAVEKKDGVDWDFEDHFKQGVLNDPTSLDYYLDFIDSEAAISEFSISNIGRRNKTVNDNDVNCMFEFPIEDVILIPAGRDNTEKLVLEASSKGQSYTQIDENIYSNLAGGGSQNSAYNLIRDLLYQHTNYNESVSIQMLPLYFLEPNIRIYLRDEESGINGDYMINSISMPLDVAGQMSLSCSKALEKI